MLLTKKVRQQDIIKNEINNKIDFAIKKLNIFLLYLINVDELLHLDK